MQRFGAFYNARHPIFFAGSAGALRTPRRLRIAPVDAFQHIGHLGRRDRHRTVRRRGPDELAAIQTLGVKRQPDAVMPQNLGQIAATATEDIEIPGMGIALQLLLNRQSQALHAAAHVRVASRDPDPDAARDRDHRRTNLASTRASAATSTPASTMTRRSFPISISMRPLAGAARADRAGSATTIARTKPDLCPSAPSSSVQNDRRQFSNSEREMPYRRAVDEIARGVSMLSATILSFSSSAQRRRRPVSITPSRSSCVLHLLLSIRTVTQHSTKSDK